MRNRTGAKLEMCYEHLDAEQRLLLTDRQIEIAAQLTALIDRIRPDYVLVVTGCGKRSTMLVLLIALLRCEM